VTTTLFKTIIQGRFEFGNQVTYDKVWKGVNARLETHYRNELILRPEQIFFPETLSIEIPRYVKEHIEKAYKSTVDLLRYCSQFALTGTVRAWYLDNGEIIHFENLEPYSDKSAVQAYLKGKKIIREAGRQTEAIDLFNSAIEKYDRHAQAYERRAKTNFLLKKHSDALRDYTKCLGIDPTIASAYYGRGRVYEINKAYKEAIDDFDQAIKKSVALEPVHWKSRRMKGLCHVQQREWTAAIFELKLFVSRKFKKGDTNLPWMRNALYNYGIACYEAESFPEALDAFTRAEALPDLQDAVEVDEILRLKGLSKQKCGKSGGLKDLKKSSKMGNRKSKTALKQISS
jgi:tetratricopeptide (TPR) repeat protein